ncbi:MAG: helix-turn-helix domain-containing protein [Chloroflexi bacterium]|nr:helix-turn-helix domain-containing protein [Chloroflexota bacterium]MCC6891724.1 helix-turn-helix domain-containing protein [Anaerolineae bacterium]
MEKHTVTLTEKERRKLVAIVTKGRNKASFIQRAHILLKSADGKTDAEISQWLYISESTVRRTRLRFGEAGIEAALADEPSAGREPLLTEQQEGHLVALACSAPPEGRERWTLELLTERFIADGVIGNISVESVRLILQKNISSPGRYISGAFLD